MKALFYSILLIMLALVGCETKTEQDGDKTENPVEQNKHSLDADVKVSDAYDAEKMPDGNYTDYYPNEQLKVSGLVSSGVRIGQWVSYHPNGNKQSENEYEGGVLHGKTVTYYPNGQIMYIGYYKGGNYEGDWLYYSQDGIHLKTLVYKGGKVITSEIVNDTL